MISILKRKGDFSKKLCYTTMMKMLLNSQCCNPHFEKLYFTRTCSVLRTFSNLEGRTEFQNLYQIRRASITTILPNALDQRPRYTHSHTHTAMEMFSNLQHHEEFSKMLIYLDKDLTHEINELVVEWLLRFDSLEDIDVICISATLNALSKLNIFDKMWKIEEQENFKKLIVRLATKGDRLLDPDGELGIKFSSWQLANCLNALSKWNVLIGKNWEGNVKLNGKMVPKVQLFESFVVRLIHQGNWLLDSKTKIATEFSSQSIANCLNALSKWNINELKGAKEFIEQLMKQANLGPGETNSQQFMRTDKITSVSVVKSLNALSKWNSDELQGSKEFINKLMKQCVRMVHEFIPQEVAMSLNALSKWNIDHLQDSKEFIIRLVKRGTLISDKFECQAIANSLNALSKWDIYELQGAREFIIRLVKRGGSTAGGFKPQEIGNCLNAVSKWNLEELPGSKDFIEQLVRCGNLTYNKFNAQGISNSLNALAKWNLDEIPQANEFILHLIKRGNATPNEFKAQEIANSLNALAKWNIDDLPEAVKFISGLTKRGSSILIGFNSQGVANSLNALCKWDFDELQGGKDFIIQLIKRGSSIIDGFDFKNIANSLNALSKWNIDDLPGAREFIVLAVKQGTLKINQFDSHSIANCLNALSKWHIDEFKGSKEFIVQLVHQGNSTANKFSPQGISNSLNALSKWNIDDLPEAKEFIAEMIKRGTLTSKEFGSQEVANSLHALSKWDIDHFLHSREFISQLIKQGNSEMIRFTAQGVANSLNSLFKWIIARKFDVLDSWLGSDGKSQSIKGFIVKLTKNGAEIYKEFDSQNISNTFNSFSAFDILNNKIWTENEQSQLKSFLHKLSSMDEPVQTYTLEGICRTYTTLLDWDVFNNDKFDSNTTKPFEDLVRNLENRIFTIAKEQHVTDPEVDVRFATQIIKDLPELYSKRLIESENKLLISLIQCVCKGVEKSDTSLLKEARMEKYILSGLQTFCYIVYDSNNRSNLEGVFDQNLLKIFDKLIALNVSYAGSVLQKVNELDELGIVKDRELLRKLSKSTRR